MGELEPWTIERLQELLESYKCLEGIEDHSIVVEGLKLLIIKKRLRDG